ncbi:hypothetical protein F0562_030611 [Nyssa sinensis]|uniref:Clp R domain-containing protein n=1 Tax=Nyssa sinensis TaxID=561372 RepID=A0A5J5AZA8_9ASTE|nr:hypothetical protein F0562_030611 [Nyssa sinensis]
MAPIYIVFLRFMGDDNKVNNYSYRLEVGVNKCKMIWQGVPRSIRDSHRKVADAPLFGEEEGLEGGRAVEIPFAPRVKRVLELSLKKARHLGHNYIGSEHLLLGLLREGEGVATCVLENLGVDPSNISTQVIRMVGESAEVVGAVVGGRSSGITMTTLEEYGTNLTKPAEDGKLDLVVGRQPQIERVNQILGRRTKKNPCLIKEPGVEKNVIVEGLAQ